MDKTITSKVKRLACGQFWFSVYSGLQGRGITMGPVVGKKYTLLCSSTDSEIKGVTLTIAGTDTEFNAQLEVPNFVRVNGTTRRLSPTVINLSHLVSIKQEELSKFDPDNHVVNDLVARYQAVVVAVQEDLAKK